MNYSTGIILIGHFLIGGSLIAQNSPNPTTVQPTQNQQATTQISVNSQTAVTIDAAPINIMAQPPEDEFKDEFELPPNPSPELVQKRIQIDNTTMNVNNLAARIDLMLQQSNDQTHNKNYSLQLRQSLDLYRQELERLSSAQDGFREQLMLDDEKVFNALPDGPPINPQEVVVLE